ncbi:alpha-xylosidase [Halomonas elongata]|uniref:Alpha-xylosidase n=1 Tax=Halomonas elongata TaxID=2746 RepID=A0A1B8NYV9_HALEL|nr:TIM-barrel domain-containing protein [Halomonas elongata]OBX35178.1 alpha-xylosidase [Halomonas elongata]
MRFLSDWSLEVVDTDRLVLNAGDRKVVVFVFGETLFRIFVHRHDTPRPTRTWSIDPDGTLAWEGRERLSGEGFTPPAWRLTEHEDGISVESERLKLVIARPFKLTWYARTDGGWTPIAEDRPTGGVAVARRGNGVEHYLRRYDDERYYGLGEKSGDLERSGRRFEMRTLDAMGYRAETTDPLYKHVPFTITRRSDGLAYGLFYDNLATSRIDLGNELDNYHAPYRAFRAEDGDLDLWFLLGERVLDVVKEFTRLTGGVAFGPKWSFGYSGSTMHYTDAPNAQERLGEFIALCREHDIPCDSFQLSSGYSSIGDKRYVFTWNRDKVPDPAAMVRTFREAGMHLIANIKPCLLTDHPAYDDAAEKRLFVTDSDTGDAEVSPFWDANGSHLDFTRQATVDWWKSNVDEKLLALGIDSTWNDNNEFEIVDREAQLAGFGDPLPASVAKPVLPLLMVRASQEAQIAHAPRAGHF